MRINNSPIGDIAFYTWSGNVVNPANNNSTTDVIITHNLNKIPKKIDIRVQRTDGDWSIIDFWDCTYYSGVYGWRSYGAYVFDIDSSGLKVRFGHFGNWDIGPAPAQPVNMACNNPFPAVVKLYD